mmetsp:Transcript_31654/g.62771  ORF Transcript_31654/g.62771 Transcript_31654/m.62771 type:complete len:287 (-) Transcript_31654:59-919(-)
MMNNNLMNNPQGVVGVAGDDETPEREWLWTRADSLPLSDLESDDECELSFSNRFVEGVKERLGGSSAENSEAEDDSEQDEEEAEVSESDKSGGIAASRAAPSWGVLARRASQGNLQTGYQSDSNELQLNDAGAVYTAVGESLPSKYVTQVRRPSAWFGEADVAGSGGSELFYVDLEEDEDDVDSLLDGLPMDGLCGRTSFMSQCSVTSNMSTSSTSSQPINIPRQRSFADKIYDPMEYDETLEEDVDTPKPGLRRSHRDLHLVGLAAIGSPTPTSPLEDEIFELDL